MATYVNDLRLKEISTGDESGTWGTSTNTNLELIAEAFGRGSEALSDTSTQNITMTDGASDAVRAMSLTLTGSLSQASTVTLLPNTVSKVWIIENATSGNQSVTLSQGSGANVTIANGEVKVIATDGAGSGAAVYDLFTDLSVAGNFKASGDLIIGDGRTIGSASDLDAMTIASNGQVTFSQTLIGTALDISGDIDVDGTTNLDVVDIDGAVDMASTLAVGGVVTANAGVVVDNITIDGTEIDLSSGDLTIDVAGDIILDADGADILLKDAGTTFGEFTNSSTDFVIKSTTSDKDIIFKGNDSGSEITALTLDMSDAGAATFNNNVTAFSDERLKDNIETLEDSLDKVEQLRGVTYTRDDRENIGVIAQEVEKILPEIVKTADDEMGTKSVDYSRITAVLIEAVKELSAKVKELESK